MDKNTRIVVSAVIILLISGMSFVFWDTTITGKLTFKDITFGSKQISVCLDKRIDKNLEVVEITKADCNKQEAADKYCRTLANLGENAIASDFKTANNKPISEVTTLPEGEDCNKCGVEDKNCKNKCKEYFTEITCIERTSAELNVKKERSTTKSFEDNVLRNIFSGSEGILDFFNKEQINPEDLRTEISEKENSIREINEEVNKYENQERTAELFLSTKKSEEPKIKNEIKELNKKLKDVEKIEKDLSRAQNSLAKIIKRMNELKCQQNSNKRSVINTCSSLRKSENSWNKEIEKLEQRERISGGKTNILAQISNKEQELQDIKRNEDLEKEAETKLKEFKINLERKQRELNLFKTELEKLEKEIDEKKQEDTSKYFVFGWENGKVTGPFKIIDGELKEVEISKEAETDISDLGQDKKPKPKLDFNGKTELEFGPGKQQHELIIQELSGENDIESFRLYILTGKSLLEIMSVLDMTTMTFVDGKIMILWDESRYKELPSGKVDFVLEMTDKAGNKGEDILKMNIKQSTSEEVTKECKCSGYINFIYDQCNANPTDSVEIADGFQVITQIKLNDDGNGWRGLCRASIPPEGKALGSCENNADCTNKCRSTLTSSPAFQACTNTLILNQCQLKNFFDQVYGICTTK